jgi:hypothetical protein
MFNLRSSDSQKNTTDRQTALYHFSGIRARRKKLTRRTLFTSCENPCPDPRPNRCLSHHCSPYFFDVSPRHCFLCNVSMVAIDIEVAVSGFNRYAVCCMPRYVSDFATRPLIHGRHGIDERGRTLGRCETDLRMRDSRHANLRPSLCGFGNHLRRSVAFVLFVWEDCCGRVNRLQRSASSI